MNIQIQQRLDDVPSLAIVLPTLFDSVTSQFLAGRKLNPCSLLCARTSMQRAFDLTTVQNDSRVLRAALPLPHIEFGTEFDKQVGTLMVLLSLAADRLPHGIQLSDAAAPHADPAAQVKVGSSYVILSPASACHASQHCNSGSFLLVCAAEKNEDLPVWNADRLCGGWQEIPSPAGTGIPFGGSGRVCVL